MNTDIFAIEALAWLDAPGNFVAPDSSQMPLSVVKLGDMRELAIVAEEFSADNEVVIPSAWMGKKLKLSFKQHGTVRNIRGCRFVILSPDLPIEIVVGADKARVFIGKLRFGTVSIRLWRNAIIAIGCGTSIGSAKIIAANSTVLIGKECMISDEVVIQSADQHGLVDVKGRRLINQSEKATVIKDYVWIGRRSMIMPDVAIGGGAVIGAGAIVTRDVPGFTVAAGNPARIIRKDVTWSRSPDQVDSQADIFLKNHAKEASLLF